VGGRSGGGGWREISMTQGARTHKHSRLSPRFEWQSHPHFVCANPFYPITPHKKQNHSLITTQSHPHLVCANPFYARRRTKSKTLLATTQSHSNRICSALICSDLLCPTPASAAGRRRPHCPRLSSDPRTRTANPAGVVCVCVCVCVCV